MPVLRHEALHDERGWVRVWTLRGGRYSKAMNHRGSAAYSNNVRDSTRGWRLLTCYTSAVIAAWKSPLLKLSLDPMWAKNPDVEKSADGTPDVERDCTEYPLHNLQRIVQNVQYVISHGLLP